MSEDNYATFQSVYQGVEPPDLYKDNFEIIDQMNRTNQDLEYSFENDNQLKSSEISNPFEIKGYEFLRFNYTPTSETKQVVNKPTVFKKGEKAYVEFMYPYLYEALSENGIDPDKWTPVLVAHTAHESGWGNEWSRKNNNFAGIKGKGSGNVKTKEWDSKRGYYSISTSFKRFNSVEEFADEYVKKLKNRFKAFEGSPSQFASNLRKRGYYTAKLEDYQNAMSVLLAKVNKYLK